MSKLEYDNLLGEYLDEGGQVYDGLVEVDVDTHEATKSELQKNVDKQLQEQQANQVLAIHKTIENLKNQIDRLKAQETILRTKLLETMQKNDIVQIEMGNLLIIRKHTSNRKYIDTKRLKQEMPDIAQLYMTETIVSETLQIKNKGEQKNEI